MPPVLAGRRNTTTYLSSFNTAGNASKVTFIQPSKKKKKGGRDIIAIGLLEGFMQQIVQWSV
jgi:hypothetical protein